MKNCSLFIVDIDLVGYSTKTEPQQCKFAREFHPKIKEILNTINITDGIVIPTGDGVFLGYENIDPEHDYQKAVDFIFEIKKWADINELKFRAAINYGAANIIESDVNNNKNLVGDLINNTARIIDAGDKDAVIIHKEYYERFIRDDVTKIDKYRYEKIDEGTVIDKHHYKHICYSVLISDDTLKVGNSNKLKLNYMTQIVSQTMPKTENLEKTFPERLKDCNEVIFYGIYNPTALNSIKKIDFSDNRKVNIKVIYAADSLKEQISDLFGSKEGKLDFNNKQFSIAMIKDWYEKTQFRNNITLELFEYTALPTFGASFVDRNVEGKGFIHISNYLQNIVPDDTPYFELEYLTSKMPYLYNFYFDFFNSKIIPNLKRIN
ncbi:hypothetical protein [Treponema sp.]|uniref:hypothetical protein n=1 Tax=Treponema sp. TaxID=166 RepID=UPI00298E5FE8|nr:hypothetical protein [Treponema sp.]MCQ2240246.1 hypothetical protein [Treponema sp.]